MGSGCGGVTCIKPGRRNVAGEMLREALIPLQPTPPTASRSAKGTQRDDFQINLTVPTIKQREPLATNKTRGARACERDFEMGDRRGAGPGWEAMAVRPGFEPGQRPPKGLVLPLHHRTNRRKLTSIPRRAKRILETKCNRRKMDLPGAGEGAGWGPWR